MSKSSPFASFANAAHAAESTPAETILSKKLITVKELMEALQKMVEKDPSSAKAVVLQVEFGGLTETRTIELNDGTLVFKS